jgi:1-acyl-sn-glycerol-3-phosphate acyltransferase
MTRDELKQRASWCLYSVLRGPTWALAKLFFDFWSTGREHLPASGPVLIVSNHQSHLDPPIVGLACSRQLKYLARHGLFFWPFSWLIRSLGAVPLDKKAGGIGGIKKTLQLLRANEAVLVFPEGTRTNDGSLSPMLPGFCAIARRSRATIVPVAIDGAFAALPRGSLVPRPNPITVILCPPVSPAQYEALSDDELVALTARRIEEGLRSAQLRGDTTLLHYPCMR